MSDAASLIERSIRHNEIVTASWDQDLESDLLCESDDSAENGGALEFWGVTDDGHEWRVHLERSSMTTATCQDEGPRM